MGAGAPGGARSSTCAWTQTAPCQNCQCAHACVLWCAGGLVCKQLHTRSGLLGWRLYLRGEAGLWWLQVLLCRLWVIVRVTALPALQICVRIKARPGQQSPCGQLCRNRQFEGDQLRLQFCRARSVYGCMLSALSMRAWLAFMQPTSSPGPGHSPHSCSATCVSSMSGGRPCAHKAKC